MSYEHLYIITDGDKKAYKSADNPYWLWEDGNIIGLVPIFVVATTAWALGTLMIFAFICMAVMWAVWIINFNLHELFYMLRLRVYLRSGRVLKPHSNLAPTIREMLGISKYGVGKVTSDTFAGLKTVFADYKLAEATAPDKWETWQARHELGVVQVREVLRFELATRRAKVAEDKREVDLFNDNQQMVREMYNDG